MNTFYKLKYKYGRYAIQNLSLYLTICFAAGYLLLTTSFGMRFYTDYLAFIPEKILHFQIWRILTTILYPPFSGNILYAVLAIFIFYNFSSIVERTMGSFEFNIYFFGSVIIGEIGCMLYYFITKNSGAIFLPSFTYFSMFMAFCILYPDTQVLLFFIIPIKTKIIGIIEAVMYIWTFFTGDGTSAIYGIAYTRIAIIFAFIPVVLFYLIVNKNKNGGGGIISNLRFRMEQRKRRKQWEDQWK